MNSTKTLQNRQKLYISDLTKPSTCEFRLVLTCQSSSDYEIKRSACADSLYVYHLTKSSPHITKSKRIHHMLDFRIMD